MWDSGKPGFFVTTRINGINSEFAFETEAACDRFIRVCGDDLKTLWGISE